MVSHKKKSRGSKQTPGSEDDTAAGGSFARRLGSSDKGVREKTLAIISTWLIAKKDVSELDMRKIWKGIFYAFWHSDKAPVQAEAARSLAKNVCLMRHDTWKLYFGEFFSTLRREWAGIDRLRLDKFYLLIRTFLRAAFEKLQHGGWDQTLVSSVAECLRQRTLVAQDTCMATGVNLHIADVFLEELFSVQGVTVEGLFSLLQPFLEAMASDSNKVIVERIHTKVFGGLLRHLHQMGNGAAAAHSAVVPAGPILVDVTSALVPKLFELASAPDVPSFNRRQLYKTHGEFQAAAAAALPAEQKAGIKKDGKKRKGAGGGASLGVSAGSSKLEGNGVQEEVVVEAKSTAGCTPVAKKGKKKKQQQEEAADATPDAIPFVFKSPTVGLIRNRKEGAANLGASAGAPSAGASSVDVPDSDGQLHVADGQKLLQGLKGASKGPQSADGGRPRVTDSQPVGPKTELGKRAKKRVKFVLTRNVEFAKGGPVPPPSVRTPPTARPKGSALKRSARPGPINVMKVHSISTTSPSAMTSCGRRKKITGAGGSSGSLRGGKRRKSVSPSSAVSSLATVLHRAALMASPEN